MDAKEIVAQLRAALAEAKAQGRSVVPIEALKRALTGLEAHVAVEGMKLQHGGDIEHYRVLRAADLEMFKSVLEAGESALKALLLINGAAAVALLSFLGNVLTKDTSSPDGLAPGMSAAMLAFGVGVAYACAALAIRFFTQATYAGDFSKTDDDRNAWAARLRVVAVIFGLGSLGAFLLGILIAFGALHL